MRTTAIVIALVSAGAAVAQPPPPAPTGFESFIADPQVIVEFEQWVGTLASRDAKLSVTVLSAHDTRTPTTRMQGVRFALEDNAGGDVVYVDESGLADLVDDLADIEQLRQPAADEAAAPYRVAGTARCWMPARPLRVLCPSYRSGPDWSGLLLGAYGGRVFEFPDRQPAELAALIRDAAALLASRQPPP